MREDDVLTATDRSGGYNLYNRGQGGGFSFMLLGDGEHG